MAHIRFVDRAIWARSLCRISCAVRKPHVQGNLQASFWHFEKVKAFGSHIPSPAFYLCNKDSYCLRSSVLSYMHSITMQILWRLVSIDSSRGITG